MAVGAHVDRHAVEPDGEVGAVVEIWHAAQEVLLICPRLLCWVTIRPGAASSTSPGRSTGRVFSVSPEMRFSLAALVGSDSSDRGAVTVTAGRTVEALVPGPNGSGA